MLKHQAFNKIDITCIIKDVDKLLNIDRHLNSNTIIAVEFVYLKYIHLLERIVYNIASAQYVYFYNICFI